jgi:hypothetical protein
MKRHVALYIINILLLVASIIVAITGIIKFPGLFDLLNIDPYKYPLGLFTWLHDWLGLAIVVLTLIHLAMNWAWIKGMTAKLVDWKIVKLVVGAAAIILFLVFLISLIPPASSADVRAEAIAENLEFDESELLSPEELRNSTAPIEIGNIGIRGVGEFEFPVDEIMTVRPDVFKPGYFSVFDVLVYLDSTNQIDLEYHFSEEHGTHLIDSINGSEHFWYIAYYDGGWAENNVWPMDLYPYKDKMVIALSEIPPEAENKIRSVFSSQVSRGTPKDDLITIPEVVIRGRVETMQYENVTVTPHNLRNDYLQENTITALDVILSLNDQNELTYDLNWYESIGSAGVVKNYFVDAINEDRSVGRCGFVYEVGERRYYGFHGNHIHIPPDLRVLDSVPEYVEFFWICI